MASPSRAPTLLALGVRLAGGGLVAMAGYIVAGLTVLIAIAVAVVLARRGSDALADVPGAAARALAWGAGTMLAFNASTRAFRRHRDDGVRALLTARGVHARRYVTSALLGVSALLALVVAGGTLVVGAVALGLAGGGRTAMATRGTFDALVYAVAFAITFGPFAVATLGARSRGAGYGVFALLLVVPEACARSIDSALPRAWVGLESLPGILGSLAHTVASPFDGARLARALVAVVVIVVVAVGVVHAEVAAVDRRSTP